MLANPRPRPTDATRSLTLLPRVEAHSPDAANDAGQAHAASDAPHRAAPNPLWVIAIGMAVFFAAGAAIVALT